MQTSSHSPVPLELIRKGGSIITARVDFWTATTAGWDLSESSIFQDVTKTNEKKAIKLPKGSYTVVFVCRVEESINGIFDFSLQVNGTVVGLSSGNVDTTSNPHDSTVLKNQFVLEVN